MKKVGVFPIATGRAFVVRALGSSHIVILKVRAGLAFLYLQSDRFSFRIPRWSQKFCPDSGQNDVLWGVTWSKRWTYCEKHRHRTNPNQHWILIQKGLMWLDPARSRLLSHRYTNSSKYSELRNDRAARVPNAVQACVCLWRTPMPNIPDRYVFWGHLTRHGNKNLLI